MLHGNLPLELAGLAAAVLSIKVGGMVYTVGWRRYRRKLPGRFAGPQLAAFLGGLVSLWVAIASPLDKLADTRLSAHMFQHILLLTVAPALLLLGALFTGLCSPSGADDKVQTELYTVVDGYKVDPDTLQGFKTWRAAACDRCHGANQEGLVGPALVESLKVLTLDDFKKTITEGRLEKGMPSFKTSKMVMSNMDHLYAYLKGRSDGAITKSKVEPMQ
jgi:mono/diheme cytochrome c family protein